jgi:uncharacterized protein (TIGR00290 family)
VGIPTVLAYSGGKDSSFALQVLRQDPRWEVVRLMTTATRPYGRSSMHGVREALMWAQAEAIGLPLDVVWLEAGGTDEAYQHAMRTTLARYQSAGIETIAFGDLFLEDVRAYRERLNESVGMHSVFPLWGRDTAQLAEEFVAAGFQAIVVCVDTAQLSPAFLGRLFDREFLADLPAGIDPCAERGEFHTFCFDGPVFRHPIGFHRGEQVLREGRFAYQDLLP